MCGTRSSETGSGAELSQARMIPVHGDRVQLQQVVLNLILNSVEALSSVEEGVRELSIITEQGQTGDILVAVQRFGKGIDRENLERVFEPFYTTKASGVGWGWRSAGPSSSPMGVVCGRKSCDLGAPCFNSHCRQARTIYELSSLDFLVLEPRQRSRWSSSTGLRR